MHRIPSNTICVMSALCLGASAVSAEPIVAILPEQTTEVVLTDLDEGFPQARLFSFESYDGNPQLYLLYPGLVQLDENGQGVFPPFEQFDSVAGGPIDPGYWGPGLVLPNDTAPNAWARASGFLDFRPQLPSLAWYSLEQAEFCGIVGCSPAYPDGDIEITENGGELSKPLRQNPTTPEQNRYCWVAFRRVEYSPHCAADQRVPCRREPRRWARSERRAGLRRRGCEPDRRRRRER